MAKGKAGSVQNRAIYSRISFLQQAAVTLSLLRHPPSGSGNASNASASSASGSPGAGAAGETPASVPLEGISRRLATDLRAVSLKTRIRLKPVVKQTICKFCDSVLIEGSTCTSTIENKSKGGKKPWADVLVRKCRTCGRERRYPVNAVRPRRKTEREVSEVSSQLQKQQEKG